MLESFAKVAPATRSTGYWISFPCHNTEQAEDVEFPELVLLVAVTASSHSWLVRMNCRSFFRMLQFRKILIPASSFLVGLSMPQALRGTRAKLLPRVFLKCCGNDATVLPWCQMALAVSLLSEPLIIASSNAFTSLHLSDSIYFR